MINSIIYVMQTCFSDASYDPGTERLIRLWLLDAAIQQFSFDSPSKVSYASFTCVLLHTYGNIVYTQTLYTYVKSACEHKDIYMRVKFPSVISRHVDTK